jgi:HK97 gp10 family phage protein
MNSDMNADVQKFKADIPAIAKILNMKVSSVVKQVALACVAEIIPNHPVDTGYSRANWRIGSNEPNTQVSVPPTYLAKRSGGLPGTSKKGWYPMQQPSAATIKEGVTNVFVTNSVHYVRWLEHGTSRMPPLNFIANAAQRVAARMEEFVRKAKGAGGGTKT